MSKAVYIYIIIFEFHVTINKINKLYIDEEKTFYYERLDNKMHAFKVFKMATNNKRIVQLTVLLLYGLPISQMNEICVVNFMFLVFGLVLLRLIGK